MHGDFTQVLDQDGCW